MTNENAPKGGVTLGELWEQIRGVKADAAWKICGFLITAAVAIFVAGGAWTHWGDVARLISAKSTETGAIAVAGERSQTFYGYYGELKKDGTGEITEEQLKIEFHGTTGEVKATAFGDVTDHDQKVRRDWKFSGFTNANYLVLSFATTPTDKEPNPNGLGVYELEKIGSSEYTGTAIYMDCDLGSVVQCPYALSPFRLTTDAVKARWSRLFAQTCRPLPLAPDSAKAIALTENKCKFAQN